MTDNKNSKNESRSDGQKSDSNNKRRNNRNRNRNRNRNKNKNRDGIEAKGSSGEQPRKNGPPKNNRNNNNKNRNRNRNNKNKKPQNRGPLKDHEVTTRYDNLLQQHLNARKKYYELFFRKGKQQVEKLERNYFKTGYDLRSFEKRLNPTQLEILEKKINSYPLDLDYSLSSQEKVIEELPSAPYYDPHFNEVQQGRPDYSNDTEETSGSMDDYEKYKEEMSA